MLPLAYVFLLAALAPLMTPRCHDACLSHRRLVMGCCSAFGFALLLSHATTAAGTVVFVRSRRLTVG